MQNIDFFKRITKNAAKISYNSSVGFYPILSPFLSVPFFSPAAAFPPPPPGNALIAQQVEQRAVKWKRERRFESGKGQNKTVPQSPRG